MGLRELELIAESAYRQYPPRLSWQPIFYPVLTREYARAIVAQWNSRESEAGHCGFVTEFDVDDEFVGRYPVQQLGGGAAYRELWVPAEELPEFNAHIRGPIRVVESVYGPRFAAEVDPASGLPVSVGGRHRMNTSGIGQFIDSLSSAFRSGDEAVANKAAEKACVDLLQEQYRAIARGDFEAFSDTLDENVEMETVGPEAIPMVGSWRGRDEVAEAVRRNFALLDEQRPEVLTLVAQGDTVVVVGREGGRVRATGRAYDIHWVHQFTFRKGRLTKFRQVFDSVPLRDAFAAGNRRGQRADSSAAATISPKKRP